jgi:hypothetical protein
MTLIVAAVALLVSLAGSVELEGYATPLPPDAVPLAASSRFRKRISAASAEVKMAFLSERLGPRA